jgi:hypothetical protein
VMRRRVSSDFLRMPHKYTGECIYKHSPA